ncbi:MAG: tail fiber domain-containing protein [SAR324 cluster bacterium]|nr:tail fiber domain-containing protein [SAR324 cluster bacterium]
MKRIQLLPWLIPLLVLTQSMVFAQTPASISVPHTFTSGTVISSSEVNTNFSSIFSLANTIISAIAIDASDNVGIGTTSPQTLLHVEGNTPVIRISDNNSTSEGDATGKIEFYDRNNTDILGWFGFNRTGSSDDLFINQFNNKAIIFETNGNTERMRITGGGKVGIGTSSPSTFFVGTEALGLVIDNPDSSSANPSVELILKNSKTNSFARLGFASAESSTMDGEIKYNHDNDGMYFYTASNERMRIDSSGDVGIGTGSPGSTTPIGWDTGSGSVLLEVAGSSHVDRDAGIVLNRSDSGITGSIWMDNSHGTMYIDSHANGASSEIHFRTKTSGTPVEAMTIDAAGNIGIGTTSPSYKIHVVGTAGLSTGTAWTNASDRRLKDVTGQYKRGLKEIIKLQPITFNYKKNNPRGLPNDYELTGFVAQEVQKVFPEAVSEGEDGYLDFNIHSINIAMVNAIKELNAENDTMKEIHQQELSAMQAKHTQEIIDLKAMVEQMAQQMASMSNEMKAIKASTQQTESAHPQTTALVQ